MKLYESFVLLLALVNKSSFASVDKPHCGGQSSMKTIRLVSPKNALRVCDYTINAYSNSVCQLRIDLDYVLAPPSLPTKMDGLQYVQCDKDYFKAGNLRLCGVETSQHIYLPFNRTNGVRNVSLIVALASRGKENIHLPHPEWNILVTQLECPGSAGENKTPSGDNFLVAPAGCLQYFPHSQGTVTSFNLMDGTGIYPGGLNYAICFRRTDNTESLTTIFEYFSLGFDKDHNDFRHDHLVIPQARMYINSKRITNFYGDILQGMEVISTNPGPLMILFCSRGYNLNRSGFKFNYTVNED